MILFCMNKFIGSQKMLKNYLLNHTNKLLAWTQIACNLLFKFILLC